MFMRRAIFAILLVSLLFVGVSGITSMAYRAGWSQGYMMGQAADGQAVMPFGPYGHSGWHSGFGFPVLGLLCPAGLLFLLFFGFMGRRHHGRWAKHRHDWHKKHGEHWGPDWRQGPPWVNPDEPVQKA